MRLASAPRHCGARAPPHMSRRPCAPTTRHPLRRRSKISLSLAQRNGKLPQCALNLLLTRLQESGAKLESRLPELIQLEKENKKKEKERKEKERKEQEIARKKAPARPAPHADRPRTAPAAPRRSIDPRRRARCSAAGCRGGQEAEGQGEAGRGGSPPLRARGARRAHPASNRTPVPTWRRRPSAADPSAADPSAPQATPARLSLSHPSTP